MTFFTCPDKSGTGARFGAAVGIALAVFVVGVVSGGTAGAREGDFVVVGAGISRTHDDNLFRLPAELSAAAVLGTDQRSDDIDSTEVSARLEKLWGRQRFKVDASVRDVSFATFKTLDYRGKNLLATWDWVVGNRLSGRVLASRETTLTSFTDFRPNTIARSLYTQQNRRFFADYWLHADWHADGAIERRESTNSLASRQVNDYVIDEQSLGLRYVDGSGRELSLRGRWLQGDYPFRVVTATLDDGFRQRHVDLAGRWLLTGKSSLTGSVGSVSRTHEHLPQRDYSGVNGQVGWEWGVAGKTSVAVNLKRELSTVEDFSANFVDSRSLTISPTWAVSDKFTLQARYQGRHVSHDGDPGFAALGVPPRVDRNRSTSLNAIYAPRPWLSFSGGIQEEQRDSNVAGLAFKARLLTLGLNAEL